MEQQNRHPQDIDITIKDIILPLLESKLMRDIIGIKYKRELDSVFKTTKERRVDLLLELEDDSILHIEFQRDLSIVLCLITESPVEYLQNFI